jgi:hypothetical protein
MKKVLFLLILVVIVARLNAQNPQARPKAKTPTSKADTIKKQDNMPVMKPKDNAKMPVATPSSNSRMPVLNPDSINKKGKGKPAPKPQK